MIFHHWLDPHMLQAGRSFLKAWYITFGVFLGLFVFFHVGGALYSSILSSHAEDALHAGIQNELAYLKQQGDVVAKKEELLPYLGSGSGDNAHLIELLNTERSARSVGLMGVANANGIILGRTAAATLRGDNFFLTTPQGRHLDRTGEFQSVEIAGSDPSQLIIVTGREILSNNKRAGALFAGHSMDDVYASHFRDKYLPAGVEVAFYTKEFGIYGDSFHDTKTSALVSSYFNSGSEWIQDGVSGKTLSLGDGTYVLVDNTIFPGVEDSPGGTLLFIPRTDISTVARLVTAGLTTLVFLFLVIRVHVRSQQEERGWRYYMAVVCAATPVFLLAFFILYVQNSNFLTLNRIPYPLYNSTLRLQPDYGVYALGFQRPVGVIVDTGDESINAVEFAVKYDPLAVEVTSLSVASSTCAYNIEQSIDHAAGVVRLSCVIINSKSGRGSLRIADIIVEPKRTGVFELSFISGDTKVLADDGLATDVLRMVQGGSYRVESFLSTSTTAGTSIKPFVVFSSTHPNQSRWYNASSAHFLWQGKPDEVYAYAFDTQPNTIPSNDKTLREWKIDIAMPGDGIFYFHLKSSSGEVSHYRIQVDRTPPTILAMRLSAEKIYVGDVARLSFDAEDAASGVQRNYYVDLGNHLFLPVGAELYIPFIHSGEQPVTLRVYDDAGNYSQKKEIIKVQSR